MVPLSGAEAKKIRRRQQRLPPSFPSVYTTSLKFQDLQNSQEVISEMDLLHIDCSSSRIDDCQVYTLIHSPDELDYMQTMVDLHYDGNATDALLLPPQRSLQANGEVTIHHYSTISGNDCYLDLHGMYDWLQDFVDTAPPHLDVSLIDIGDSYNKTVDPSYGYDIYALRITSASSTISKSPLMLLSGIHPREYSPPELVRQWILGFLDPDNLELQTILESTEIHWIPYANPDGRYYAETSQPFRRKNLNPSAAGSEWCNPDEYGVDINRNFPFRWGLSSGSSTRACTQTYRGASAGSEPETQAVTNYALSIFPQDQRREVDDFYLANVEAYDERTASGVFVDIHSFGNYYIWVRTFVENHVVVFRNYVSC
jgi:hypothetical protein